MHELLELAKLLAVLAGMVALVKAFQWIISKLEN